MKNSKELITGSLSIIAAFVSIASLMIGEALGIFLSVFKPFACRQSMRTLDIEPESPIKPFTECGKCQTFDSAATSWRAA